MPTQRSVATRFWTSATLRNVSPYTKLLMLYCLTCPRSTFIGFFRFSIDDCTDETGLTRKQIESAMREAESVEFLQWDRETHYVWVCKRVYYEFPKGEISARQQEGIRRILEDAPNSSIKFRLCERYKGYGKPFMDGYGNGTDPASGSLLPLPDPKDLDQTSHHRGDVASSTASIDFDRFWSAYPRKVGKGAAHRAWAKINPATELVERMLSALSWQRTCEQWTKDKGTYIPHPATWLNQERWTDEPPAEASKAGPIDPKSYWKSQAEYVEAMRAGRVPPKWRVIEWESNKQTPASNAACAESMS